MATDKTENQAKAEIRRAQTAERQRRWQERRKVARLAELAAKGLPPAPLIPTMPSRERWKALQEQARAALQTMQEEMQSYYNDRSEKWQESEKGGEFQERLDQVDAARASVEEIGFE
jgi:hypothetical protein